VKTWVVSVVVLVTGIMGVQQTAGADDGFPLIGTYLQDQTCKGDGSDSAAQRVKIMRDKIESNFGLCSILDHSRNGNTIAAHISCPSASGTPIMGDVTFTIRDDKTVAFADQDNVYSAVLHKCPE
jgi:hypothetical protein